jgi:hypothetical protein
MAKAPDLDTGFVARIKQIGLVFRFTAKRDKLFIPLVIVGVAIAIGLTALLWLLLNWVAIFAGIMLVLLAVLIVLNLRANKAMMIEAENQPGAAASIVENMRGRIPWRVTPALASTTDMDFVHLVICRAGVVLMGEAGPSSTPGRVRSLINQERKRLSKVVGSAEMLDFIVGRGEGEVPIAKVRMRLMRLPRKLTGPEVNALDKRLKALNARPQMPKGAIPKNMRPPRGQFKASRGR